MDDGEEIHLLTLPDVVITWILDRLDITSLKRLRLTCRKTNSWIDDDPAYLKKFKVRIRDYKRLNEVVNSPRDWTNFNLRFKRRDKYDSFQCDSILEFLDRFGPTMIMLKIRVDADCDWQDVVLGILTRIGGSLESLHINVNRVNNRTTTDKSLRKYLYTGTAIQNLIGLKHFNIEFHLDMSDLAIKFIRQLYKKVMDLAPKLTFVTIPTTFRFGYGEENTTGESAVGSLIEYVHGMASRNPIWPKSRPSIDFTGNRDYGVGVQHSRPVYPFALTPKNLIDLARACARVGCELFHVPSTAMPMISSAKTLKSDELFSLAKAVKSVLLINNPGIEHQRNIFLPEGAELKVVIRIVPAMATYDGLQVPASVNVSSLRFEVVRPIDSVVVVLGIPRPSVQELTLFWGPLNPETPPDFQLMNFYPNLRILKLELPIEIIQVERLLVGLERLEDLTLNNTPLRDSFFLRRVDDQLVLPGLRNLVHLRIKYCDLREVSDICFQEIFQNMKLKTFILHSHPRTMPNTNITFRGGISSLAGDMDGFKGAIHRFECYIPKDTSREEMVDFMESFPYLKYFELYEEDED